jgi:hypothetical protein
MLKNIFWNKDEMRVRAGWRFLAQFILSMALLNGFMFFLQQFALMRYGQMPTSMAEDPIGLTALIVFDEIVAVGLFTLSIWICGRFLDKRRFADFGLHLNRRWWGDLFFGLLLGGFLMSLIFFVEMAAGWVTVTGYFTASHLPGENFLLGALPKIAMFLGIGFREELLARGYQLTNLAEGLGNTRLGKRGGLILATILSSMLFGLLHAANPNSTVISTLLVMVGGLMLATGYILTGELALSIGLHITWNFFQNVVFGFPVSGMSAYPAYVVALEQNGPDLMTGGAFGPEAGLLGFGAMLLGMLMITLWVRWRDGQIKLQSKISTTELQPDQVS